MNIYALLSIIYVIGYFYTYPIILSECEKDITSRPSDPDIEDLKLQLKVNVNIGALWWPFLVVANLFSRYLEALQRLNNISRINKFTKRQQIKKLSSFSIISFTLVPIILYTILLYFAFTYKS